MLKQIGNYVTVKAVMRLGSRGGDHPMKIKLKNDKDNFFFQKRKEA